MTKRLRGIKDKMVVDFLSKLPSNKFDRYNMEWAYNKGVSDGFKFFEEVYKRDKILARLPKRKAN